MRYNGGAMIYYFIIFVAVAFFTAQFVFTRLFSRTVKETAVTALGMLVVFGLVGALVALVGCGGRPAVSWVSLLLAAAFAAVMVPYYVLGIKALSLGSLAVYSTFMMLGGMLLPFLYGILLLAEDPTAGKLIGCVFLSVAILLQGLAVGRGEGGGVSHDKGGTRGRFFLLCLAIFLINGMTGVISQTHALQPRGVDEWSFTLLYSLLTAAFALALLVARLLPDRKSGCEALRPLLAVRPLLLAAALGLCANLGNLCILLAAPHIDASIQFPMISGGTIALSALAALLFFRERPSRLEGAAILGACLSTVLFAF